MSELHYFIISLYELKEIKNEEVFNKIKLLIDEDTNVLNKQDNDGNTPLHLLFLDKNTDSKFITSFKIFVEKNYKKFFELLLSNENINIKNKEDNTYKDLMIKNKYEIMPILPIRGALAENYGYCRIVAGMAQFSDDPYFEDHLMREMRLIKERLHEIILHLYNDSEKYKDNEFYDIAKNFIENDLWASEGLDEEVLTRKNRDGYIPLHLLFLDKNTDDRLKTDFKKYIENDKEFKFLKLFLNSSNIFIKDKYGNTFIDLINNNNYNVDYKELLKLYQESN